MKTLSTKKLAETVRNLRESKGFTKEEKEILVTQIETALNKDTRAKKNYVYIPKTFITKLNKI